MTTVIAPHLSNDEFFTRLSTLFSTKSSSSPQSPSSIYLTQKRLSYPSPTQSPSPSPSPTPPTPSTSPLLIRASNGCPPTPRRSGHKIKFSTIVQPSDLETFFTRYAEVIKEGTVAKGGLKKRDKGGKKAKEKRERRRRERENKKKGWPKELSEEGRGGKKKKGERGGGDKEVGKMEE